MKRITFLLLSAFFTLNFISAAAYDNLYIVGNACAAGWNPDGALEMTKESDGVFTWSGPLLKPDGAEERFKFLVTNTWALSITCRLDASGHLMIASGEEYSLSERAENSSDPDNAFQVPENGTYSITVNLNTMKMSCTRTGGLDEEAPDPNQLYIVGDACEAGWNYVKGLEMTKVEDGIFIWTGDLTTNNGNEFKFLNQHGTWDKTINPLDGDITFTRGVEYNLNFRPKEGSPKDYKFKVTNPGRYYFLVNLNTMKIKIDYADPDLNALFIVGSATSAGWDANKALAMQEIEKGIYTWTGNLLVDNGGEFCFLNKKGTSSNTINPFGGDLNFSTDTEYDLLYRPFEASPYDFKFKVTTAARYTVDVNLNRMTVIIESAGELGIENTAANDFCNIHISDRKVSLRLQDNAVVQTAAVFDISGKCVAFASEVQGTLTLAENLPDGIYIVRIESGNDKLTEKIIIK